MSIQTDGTVRAFIRGILSFSLLVVFSIARVPLLVSLARVEASAQTAVAQSSAGRSSNTVTLPRGTQLFVKMKMTDSVDSETGQPDKRFRGTFETNLFSDGVVVAPKGTTVLGRTITAQSSGARSGGQLEFDLTDIVIDGQTYSLAASTNQAQGESATTNTGTGATAGAAVGAITGGLGGAVRGTGAGAVAGEVSS